MGDKDYKPISEFRAILNGGCIKFSSKRVVLFRRRHKHIPRRTDSGSQGGK